MLLKELVDDLGGGRSVTLGAVLVVCCYVAASRYVETIEARLSDLEGRLKVVERHDIEDQARRNWRGRDGEDEYRGRPP